MVNYVNTPKPKLESMQLNPRKLNLKAANHKQPTRLSQIRKPNKIDPIK